MTRLPAAVAAALLVSAAAAAQEATTARAAILSAEDRRAPLARDLATIRAGARSGDPVTMRMAVRALGRLERPSLIPDITPLLRSSAPEVRAEAANALGQAVRGAKVAPAAVSAAAAALQTRLRVEAEPLVRAAIDETIGRLPYDARDAVARAQQTLVAELDGQTTVLDRLGVAKGLEALARRSSKQGDLETATVDALRRLAVTDSRLPAVQSAGGVAAVRRPAVDPARDVRVRRLALAALVTAKAADAATLAASAGDADPQVRLLVMRAAADPAATDGSALISRGLVDPAAMVRIAAVRSGFARGGAGFCADATPAASDRDTLVALTALDGLRACGTVPGAVEALQAAIDSLPQASTTTWHRPAHALVALAAAAPDRAAAALPVFAGSTNPHFREYAARAATVLGDRATLERLAADEHDNVCERAIDGLTKVAGHHGDRLYIPALARTGYQAIRAAARALADTPARESAVPALTAAFDRLTAEGRDNSRDERQAIADTLKTLGVSVPALKPLGEPRTPPAPLSVADLRRLAAPRARVTMAGGASFDLALFTNEAPATVLRFARLAESGYYNGLTFHRVDATYVIQGGSPGANELVGDAAFMRDELGLWPHVRGAVGISTRGRDTGDAQVFVDLIDNPRLDHEYTVFAQVLTGMDVVDGVLEGDVIERIEILTGS